jgi:predicted nucleotide-binding protein
MALPVKTTADDVRAIVKYLKAKPTGATVAEAKAVNKSMVDGRKIAAYIAWGVVERKDGRLKLTARGLAFARDPDKESGVFREIVSDRAPYRSVIEWAYHQEMAEIDTNDVATNWHDYHRQAVGEDATDGTLRDNAVCFFNVAAAADLGTLIKGRGGNLTRLSLDKLAVKSFVEIGPTTPPWEGDGADETEGVDDVSAEETPADPIPDASTTPAPEVPDPTEPMRVFISHGSNHDVVEQIEIMLGLADFEAEIAEAEETAAIPVSKKVLGAMRRCEAGIIAVTVDESRKDDEDNYFLNENVLIESGAAFVLYDERVVLLWDKRLEVPSNLQGLYRCEFEGDELSWTAGMKLMKAIKGFKKTD